MRSQGSAPCLRRQVRVDDLEDCRSFGLDASTFSEVVTMWKYPHRSVVVESTRLRTPETVVMVMPQWLILTAAVVASVIGAMTRTLGSTSSHTG